VKLSGGRLAVRVPGGVIRYSGMVPGGNTGVEMAMSILRDLHYDKLDVGAGYRPDGQMKLDIHLHGRNPEYENGRPVAFNLNIEENLLRLLESLSLADDITNRVDEGSTGPEAQSVQNLPRSPDKRGKHNGVTNMDIGSGHRRSSVRMHSYRKGGGSGQTHYNQYEYQD
jgi:hypothetical protein